MKKIILTGLLAALAIIPQAQAQETTTSTVTTIQQRNAPVLVAPTVNGSTTVHVAETPKVATGTRVINLSDFDMNRDMMLSRGEIGDKLFQIYDTDGNKLIDNIEYARSSMLTLVPFDKETTYSYDFNGDGVVDQQTVTRSSFAETTMLTRFDNNTNGLSPREFTNRPFAAADINNDHFVDQAEWRGSYIASLDAYNKSRPVLND